MESRQIHLERTIEAPRAVVWRAWTDPDLLPKWFGPEGYHCITREISLHQGGQWRFDMIGPDGTVWVNRHRYLVMQPQSLIEFLLDADDDSSPPMEVRVELSEAYGKTTLRQTITFPTEAARNGALAFGADRLGQTTLAKLEALVLAL